MPAYPPQLPGPVWAELSGAARPAFERTEMAIGNARYRRISTNPPRLIALKWKFSAREFALFSGWVRHDLIEGNAWFTLPLACGSGRVVPITCHFVGPYEHTGGPTGTYVVTAQVETRDWQVLTPAELAALIAGWDQVEPPPPPPPAVVSQIGFIDSLGAVIYPHNWGISRSWNADGTLAYEQTTNGVYTWRRFCGYADGRLSTMSGWVRQ